MKKRAPLLQTIRRFTRCERGVAIVEFAITLPLMLLVFAVIIEGSRTFWAYQSVISAVRDATRYAARATGFDICPGGGELSTIQPRVATIVNASVMPGAVTITGVNVSGDCIGSGVDLRPEGSRLVATVTASITIAMPFAGIFRLVGTDLGAITTTVSNSTRVYGQ